MEQFLTAARFLPFLTALIALLFARALLSRWQRKENDAPHLWWWGIGILIFGAGGAVEALVTFMGWHEVFFKSWYILGGLMGGAPLALGSFYLLVGRKPGDWAVVIVMSVIAITSVLVVLSPIDYTAVQQTILTTDVLGWDWIRNITPIINSFASVVLVGGAAYSAGYYSRHPYTRNRFIGNVLIAAGATLPAVGGLCGRYGLTEILYVGEFVGIILIWFGYRWCLRPQEVSQTVTKKMVFDKPYF